MPRVTYWIRTASPTFAYCATCYGRRRRQYPLWKWVHVNYPGAVSPHRACSACGATLALPEEVRCG